MYADIITDSMRATIDETNRHRTIQMQYNTDHNITPTQIKKGDTLRFPTRESSETQIITTHAAAAEPTKQFMSKKEIEREIQSVKSEMERAAKKLDFVNAAKFRDRMFELQAML